MSDREDKIRRVVAELDVHIAEVEASIAILKALLAEDEIPGDEDPSQPGDYCSEAACKRLDASL